MLDEATTLDVGAVDALRELGWAFMAATIRAAQEACDCRSSDKPERRILDLLWIGNDFAVSASMTNLTPRYTSVCTKCGRLWHRAVSECGWYVVTDHRQFVGNGHDRRSGSRFVMTTRRSASRPATHAVRIQSDSDRCSAKASANSCFPLVYSATCSAVRRSAGASGFFSISGILLPWELGTCPKQHASSPAQRL